MVSAQLWREKSSSESVPVVVAVPAAAVAPVVVAAAVPIEPDNDVFKLSLRTTPRDNV